MSLDLIKKLPLLAKETKDKFSKTLITFQNDESSYFFNESLTKEQVYDFINSKYSSEVLCALKKIIAMFLSGKDIGVYIPKIIQKLPLEDKEIKRLCQFILCELSCSDFNKDNLLMCIQPLHKEILSQQIILRGDAFKTLASLNLSEITPIISQTINKIIIDKSAYVRKISCFGLFKIYKNDKTSHEKSEINHYLKYLMKDVCFVKGSALMIFSLINNYSEYGFLHPYFRKICKDLPFYSTYDLIFILDLLHRYCKIFFNEKICNIKNPNQDLECFLASCEKLLRSMHPEVVVELANIFLDFPSEERITKITKALIRFLNLSSETKLIVLQSLKRISFHFPDLVKPFYKNFFLINLEKFYCKLLKIEILYILCDESNMTKILDELSYYCKSNNPQISCFSIETIGKLALKGGKFLSRCTKILLNLFKMNLVDEIDDVVLALTRIITNNLKGNLYILIYCLKIIPVLKNPKPRSNIISLICEIVESIPSLATEILRTLILSFNEENMDIKFQIMNLNMQLLLKTPQDFIYRKFLFKTFLYILQLFEFDQEIVLRDHARLIKNFIIKLQDDSEKLSKDEIRKNIYNVSDEMLEIFLKNVREKKLSLNQDFLLNTLNSHNENQANENKFQNAFTIGSVSNLINFRFHGYNEMPKENDWILENTEKLRESEETVLIKKNDSQEVHSKPSSSIVEKKENEIENKAEKNEKKHENSEKKMNMQENLTSHFQNLNQALNDFFSSEEEEESEENSEK